MSILQPELLLCCLSKLLFRRAKDITSSLTFQECTSLLGISHMWGFDEIFLTIKSRIRNVLWATIGHVDKINLAHEFELKEWYAVAYCELATRPDKLSVEEAEKLGLQFSTKMGWIREMVAEARGKQEDIEEAARSAVDKILISELPSIKQPSGGASRVIGGRRIIRGRVRGSFRPYLVSRDGLGIQAPVFSFPRVGSSVILPRPSSGELAFRNSVHLVL